MKIIISICMSLILLITISTATFAYAGNQSYGKVPKVYRELVIDGLKDEEYNNGLQIDVNRIEGSSEVYATAKTWHLWTDGWLYVYAEIDNPDKNHVNPEVQKTTPWDSDNFEVHIDIKNDAEGIALYRIDIQGYPSMLTEEGIPLNSPEEIGDIFKYAHTETSNGYTVEFKLPIKSTKGDKVGLNMQITDKCSDVSALYEYIQPQNSKGSGEASDSKSYDYIILGENPATHDNTFIYVVLAYLSLSLFIKTLSLSADREYPKSFAFL